MSSDIQTGDIRLDSNGAPYLSEKPSSNMVHITYQHFSALDIGVKYTTLFATKERDMVNGINSLFGTNFTWGRLDSKTHDFFNPVSKDPFIRLRFSNVGEFYVAQVVVDDNLQIEGAKPSTEIGEMLSKEGRPKYDTAYFASRENISVLTSFMHTNFSTRHMSFNPSRDIDSAFLALAEDEFLTPVVLQNYRNNGGYSTLLFKNEVLPAIELDVKVYSRERVAIALGAKLGVKLSEKNFTQYDMVHVFDPYKGVNEEYTIFKLTRGADVKYMAAVTAVEVNVKPVEPVEPETPDIPWTPIDPDAPIIKPKVDLSLITNGEVPGIWNAEVDKFTDLTDEGNTARQDILVSVLEGINLATDREIGFDDLTIVLGEDYSITITPALDQPITKAKGVLVVSITETFVEVVYSPTGLASNYSGTGWYKATDTGTVFCKGVPALKTGIFEVDGTQYVSVHTKEDAKTYGSRAATSNLTNIDGLFKGDAGFNEDISSWDVSNVTSMVDTFNGCDNFNQDLSVWDVSNVTSLANMFKGCWNFNSDLSKWNISNVTNLSGMFSGCQTFNSLVSDWDVSNVTDTSNMFSGCWVFNQDISGWNVSNIVEMSNMFNGASSFNQDLSQWCVSNIATTPYGFATDASSYSLPKPVWGTCPRHEDGSVPVEPLPQIDLSRITNNDTPGEWYVEVASEEERESEYDNIIANVLTAINTGSEQNVTLEDLVIYTDSSNNTFITSVTEDDTGKVIGTLVVKIKVVIQEEPSSYGPTGLRADYPGTGWYKATDTGTVFCKGVPALDTCVFEVDGLEYVSVHTKVDAATYGARAATSNLTEMGDLFESNSTFNEDIGSWDVSNVTNMYRMFAQCYSFNQDISKWDVSNVVNMGYMFVFATVFNQPIGNWHVSNVTNMESMLSNTQKFNQDISDWDVSNVTNMGGMFNSSWVFNQDISGWDVSHVTNMEGMFYFNPVFNQDLSQWCVSSILTAPSSFARAAFPKERHPVWGTCPRHEDGSVPEEPSNYGPTGLKADYPGTGWYKATDTGTVFCKDVPALETMVFEEGGLEYVSVYTSEDAKRYGERAATSNVTNMARALSNMDSIGDITSWDVSNVTTMYDMFSNFWGFNQDISKWDVSSVTNMGSMFYAVNQFNQDISGWDVSNVTNMDHMFRTNAKMNQDLSGWCVSNILVEPIEFSLGNDVWTKPKPVWGTCPRGENAL